MASDNEELRSLGIRESMHGPRVGSYWLYVAGTAIRGYASDDSTIAKVSEWSRYGGPEDAGVVSLFFYSLNGSSNNSGYTNREVPEELRRISIDDFWNLVEDKKLIHLVPVPHDFAEEQGLFDEGDSIEFRPDTDE